MIRTLLNYEISIEKLIRIIPAAQLELKDKLLDKTKKALRSRVFARSLPASMSIGETKYMIAPFRPTAIGQTGKYPPCAELAPRVRPCKSLCKTNFLIAD